jgi:hypothetical protein
MNYDTFVTEVKKLGVKKLLKEVTEYVGISPTQQRYAEYKGQLVGAYSPAQGGVIFKKPPNRWSKSGRKFEDVDI